MPKWEYAQMQVWSAIQGKILELGYAPRNRIAFLIQANNEEFDLPPHLNDLGLWNLLGSNGWEFISNTYYQEFTHECTRHGTLEKFATVSMFKRQTG